MYMVNPKKTNKSAEKKPTNTLKLTGIIAEKVILKHYATKAKKDVIDIGTDGIDDYSTVVDEEENFSLPSDKTTAKGSFYFLDQHKIKIKVWLPMIDFITSQKLPTTTNKCCWWDRHKFSCSPLGCPIRRLRNQIKKSKGSNACKDTYVTEGIFCSPECVQAYIEDQRGSLLYKESSSLLALMMYEITGKFETIDAASSWKLLKDYGGHLSIEEYRNSFGKIKYEETVNFHRPNISKEDRTRKTSKISVAPSSKYFEEKITSKGG